MMGINWIIIPLIPIWIYSYKPYDKHTYGYKPYDKILLIAYGI